MGECLRKACPCLDALWQRIFGEKPPEGEGEGRGSGGGKGEEDSSRPGGGEERPRPASPPPPPPPLESGLMYTALWSFQSRHVDELSFNEGDLFSVVSRSGDWWTARKIDKNGCVLDTGIVPKNYLDRAESLQIQP